MAVQSMWAGRVRRTVFASLCVAAAARAWCSRPLLPQGRGLGRTRLADVARFSDSRCRVCTRGDVAGGGLRVAAVLKPWLLPPAPPTWLKSRRLRHLFRCAGNHKP